MYKRQNDKNLRSIIQKTQAKSIPKRIGKNTLKGLQNGSNVEKDIFTIGFRKLISKNLNNK